MTEKTAGINKNIHHFRDLNVYQRPFQAAMSIFKITKLFPFQNKITDAMQEASETQCCLEFSLAQGWDHTNR